MSLRIHLKKAIGRLAGRETGGVPSPVVEELVEMTGVDPLIAMTLERRRDRSRRPKEEVYSRYGYLLFIPTNR